MPPARGSKSRVLPEQVAGIGDGTGGARVSSAVSGVCLVALPRTVGEIAAAGDAMEGCRGNLLRGMSDSGVRGDVQSVGDLTMIPTMLAILLRFDHYAGPKRTT